MAEQEFKRALDYATRAWEMLKRGSIPPYPHFFELLYTYASGINPGLNERVNRILTDGTGLGVDIAAQLHEEFLKSRDVNDRIDNVSRRMSARIDAMHSALESTVGTTHAYSNLLATASSDLDSELTSDELHDLVTRLHSETEQMQAANRRLEQKLQASREDMSGLQRDLEEARKEAMLDPLTKVFNRKSFDDGLAQAMADARASGDPLSLLILDIDHFKRFNDSYGHQTGDQVLRLMAMTLKSNLKGKDIAARYGGEEFTAILPQTGLAAALNVAENIRRAIEGKELLKRSTNEKLGRITASFGVASFRAQDSAAALLERADRCLYAAKRRGRNCVVGEDTLANAAA